MSGPEPRTAWRTLVARAVVRPPVDEPLDAERVRGFWELTRIIAPLACLFDLILWLTLRRDPRVAGDVLDVFVAINLPLLAALYGLARSRLADRGGLASVVVAIVATQLSVVVWIQVTGTLSSYFLVAGAMMLVAHRAMMSWGIGVVSLAALLALHGGAFALEELGALDRVPLFHADPGPVYVAPAIRGLVLTSILSVYAMAWAGGNLLIAVLRRTERALDVAERRLAAAAPREGRLTREVIAGYRLEEVVGRGGMAEVYRGVKAGAAPVAIKVVHPYLVDDASLLARVRREAALAARLPPSVTAAVREVHLAGPGERVVVLDYLEGEDLAARLRRRRRLPLSEAVALLVGVARAVDAIHAAGIVHRDLKPHNLFVLDDGTLRVLDFGVARTTDDVAALTVTAALIGTPGYMAPEMVEDGRTSVGPEADVYALGVVAYQVLTGERPSLADEALGTGPPRPSVLCPDLPVELDAVIARALSRTPEERYPSAGAFADDLVRAAPGSQASRARTSAATTPKPA